jgi:hypothetical protein
MRALYLLLALGFGAVWISCSGTGTDNLFPGAGGSLGASGNVTGASGQIGPGTSGSNAGAAGAIGSTGAGGAMGAGGKGAGGAAGQGGSGTAGSGTAAGGSAGMGQGGAGMAGSAMAGMGGSAGAMAVDAGTDVEPVPDAGPRPKIRCGATSCDSETEFCCLDDSPNCVARNNSDSCNANRDRLRCDDASDCPPNLHCCAMDGGMGNPAESLCKLDCVRTTLGRSTQILCDPKESQCPDFDPTCSANQNSVFAGYPYCH